MKTVYYIGLDIHKKAISYCIKLMDGRIVRQGEIVADPILPYKTFVHIPLELNIGFRLIKTLQISSQFLVYQNKWYHFISNETAH